MSNAERLMTNIHSYRVLDGDTIEVLGQIWTGGVYVKQKVRLSGVDTPEKNTEAGKAVRRHIIELLSALKEFKVVCTEEDKYNGRFVGEILVDGDKLNQTVSNTICEYVGEVSLNDYLIEEELAKCYGGGTKSKWTDEELNEVENTCAGLGIQLQVTTFSSTPEEHWVVLQD